ncbi:hypothetical protein A1L58_14690 [Shewanella baltica]|nr:hypothetical protein A1L58_14690 [Shewanella baltica]
MRYKNFSEVCFRMKDMVTDFFKLQNDRMKSPFFSAFICALLFYNWDIVYYLISFDSDAVTKTNYVTELLKGKSLIAPFIITVAFLVIPLFFNFSIQLILDKLNSSRQNKLNGYKIESGKDELKIADLEANKVYSLKRVELETGNNIDLLKRRLAVADEQIVSQNDMIAELSKAADAQRKQADDYKELLDGKVGEIERWNKLITELKNKEEVNLNKINKINNDNDSLRSLLEQLVVLTDIGDESGIKNIISIIKSDQLKGIVGFDYKGMREIHKAI